MVSCFHNDVSLLDCEFTDTQSNVEKANIKSMTNNDSSLSRHNPIGDLDTTVEQITSYLSMGF